MPARSDLADLLDQRAVLAATDERETRDVAARFDGEVDDRADQRRRKIVDDVPAEVLQHVGRTGTTGAGQAGDEDDLGHVTIVVLSVICGGACTSGAGRQRSPRIPAPARGSLEVVPVRHVLDRQAVQSQRVHVSGHRPVDESDPHAQLHLLGRLRLVEVRTEPPVLLRRVDHVIVDPDAARRLENRMIEEEAEPAAGSQDAADLGDRFVDVVDVFEHETRNRCVERGVGERQRAGP